MITLKLILLLATAIATVGKYVPYRGHTIAPDNKYDRPKYKITYEEIRRDYFTEMNMYDIPGLSQLSGECISDCKLRSLDDEHCHNICSGDVLPDLIETHKEMENNDPSKKNAWDEVRESNRKKKKN